MGAKGLRVDDVSRRYSQNHAGIDRSLTTASVRGLGSKIATSVSVSYCILGSTGIA
jgi:hypothetical protein